MNILSSKQFENRLAENTFSETSKYRVLLTSQLLFWFSSLLGSAMNLGGKYIFFTMVHNVVCLAIVFVGIKACYSINKRIDNTNFIEKFILLFFPINLNLILFGIPLYLLIWALLQKTLLYFELSATHIKTCNQFFPYFASFFISSAFFFMLYRSFTRLEQKIIKRHSPPPIQDLNEII